MRQRFVVDEWRRDSDLYFLTHLHADHTEGLSAEWCRGPIYCSQITAMLLLAKFKGFNPSLVHVLELASPTLVSHNGSELEVTAIDADHCPGAVLFVFHSESGCIVHTGDFRWNNDGSTLSERSDQLRQALGGNPVDVLFIDNTFCNPLFSFPSRNTAANRIIELIRGHPDHDVVIGVDNLGKEELLVCIANVLEIKICLWPERLRTMRLLELPDVFTTDTTSTRVRAVPRYTLSTECVKQLNELRPTVGVLPTGCFCLCNPSNGRRNKVKRCSESCYKVNQKTDEKLVPSSSLIHVVPYSLHCCFSELREFYQLVRPKQVRGIVKAVREYNTNPSQQLATSRSGFGSPADKQDDNEEQTSIKLVTQLDVDFSGKVQELQREMRVKYFKHPRSKRQRLHGRGVKLSIDQSSSNNNKASDGGTFSDSKSTGSSARLGS